MKKLLLPVFAGVLLTSSVALTTGQNANAVVRVEAKQKVKDDIWYEINSKSDLSEKQIKEITLASKTWDDTIIDRIINQALQYYDDKLVIDESKLDIISLPVPIVEHINLALANLNNAVSSGFIKVVVDSEGVQLIYPTSVASFSSDNEIIDFSGSQSRVTAFSKSYMWYSTYGPSRWWKFWQWGGYLHFSEQAVQNAKVVNLIASLANVVIFIKNMKEIITLVDNLGKAINVGNMSDTVEIVQKLDKILGGIALEKLGDFLDIFIILSAVYSLFVAIQSVPTWGEIIFAVIEVASSTVIAFTNKIMKTDRGNGVKWKWANFIIPAGFSAE